MAENTYQSGTAPDDRGLVERPAISDEERRQRMNQTEDELRQLEIQAGLGPRYTREQAAAATRFVAGPPPRTDAEILAEAQSRDRPFTRTIGVSQDRSPEVMQAAQAAQMKFDATNHFNWLLKMGVPADQALAKSGMNLFVPQTATRTPITPYQEQQLQIARARLANETKRLNQPPPEPLATITYPSEKAEPAQPEIPGESTWFGWKKTPGIAGVAAKPAKPQISVRLPASQIQSAITPPAAPPVPPRANEVIRVTKDGRRAVFDADTKQFLRYAQ